MANVFLEYITEFDRWERNHLTKESVFEYFFFCEEKILFIVDDAGQLSGIITLGDFIKNLNDVGKSINENYLFVRKDSQERMFSEAQEIFDRYGIESNLPVIDQESRMTGFIRNGENLYAQRLKEAENKICNFKSSHYLKKEIDAFCEVLANTTIYFSQSNDCQRIFSLFDGRIKGSILSDKDYREKLKRLILDRDKLTDEEKTELIFDFEAGNKGILADEIGITPIYNLEKFIEEFIALTENEEFSRIIRLTHNSQYSLADFISDNNMEDLEFPVNRLLTKYVYDYMKDQQIPFSLTYFNSIAVMHASFPVNGIRGSSQDVIGFASCDLFEQLLLSRMLQERRITVLNIRNASWARMTEGEKRRTNNYGTVEVLLADKNMEALKQLYGDDCGNQTPYEYAKELCYSYPVKRRFENDLIVNVDHSGPYINIENGFRRTCYQPERYTNTIYFVGPCIALGPYVEDKHTIASQLALKLMKDRYTYRIVNLGMLASNNSLELLRQIDFQENDIVINMFYTEEGEKIRKLLKDIVDPSKAFDKISDREDMFFDKSVHCNRKGNEVYAEVIFENIKPVLKKNRYAAFKTNHIYDVFRTNFTDLQMYGIPEYLEMLEREKQKVPGTAETVGSIVMNCNPFTLGHQYLVEHALQHCDYLFVFVVQEDKSYFSFEDRFAMAVDNCRQYSNVSVIPSGKMIASDLTFPEYFRREEIRDQTKGVMDIRITPVQDFRLFANYIAPVLEIKKRFVAEEPLDAVTKQYNESMRKVLEAFGFEVIEIERKKLADGEIISASKVREMYRKGKYKKMKEMLPETTYCYLMENLSGGIYEN